MGSINYLFLDSRNRTSGTASNPVFQFSDTLFLPKDTDIFVTGFQMPMTSYTVTSGVNDVIPSNLGDTTLTPGVYNVTSLLAHVASAMTTATSTTITCTVSNYLVTIASTGTPTIPWTDSTHNAARLLGFAPATDLSAAGSHTGTGPYDLSHPHFIHIKFAEIPVVNVYIPATTSTQSDRSCHFSIPVTVPPGDVQFYEPVGIILVPIKVPGNLTTKRLTLQLRDETGADVLRGEWTMVLRIRVP